MPNMSSQYLNPVRIGGRIFKLMEKRGYKSQAALARDVQMRKEEMSRIINGRRLPTIQQLEKLAAALGTSMEYLLTKGSARDNPPNVQKPKTFPERLNALMKRKGLKPRSVIWQLVSITGLEKPISLDELYKLRTGERTPRLEYVYMLSRLLNVSVDYLFLDP